MKITIDTFVKSEISSVWQAWNNPEDIMQWNAASDDWHTTKSSVDLRKGGSFFSRMEAKDGSMGFDFRGTFTQVKENELITYEMEDGRVVEIKFEITKNGIKITETFDAETENDPEFQRQGWQSILNNFTRYVESKG